MVAFVVRMHVSMFVWVWFRLINYACQKGSPKAKGRDLILRELHFHVHGRHTFQAQSTPSLKSNPRQIDYRGELKVQLATILVLFLTRGLCICNRLTSGRHSLAN